jgi:hypothetical protein
MKKKRRIPALLLAVCLSLSLLTGPASAASGPITAFRDVTDNQTAVAIESLRLLGVLDGYSDGTFRPGNSLTRAQFCKMAVYAMNMGNELGKYEAVTIYPDVKPSHWAAAYINLASKGKTIIAGYADGYFRPDRQVTFAQAVTILMRMLGYTDADVGAVWPQGHLAEAKSIGLTDGLNLSASSVLTRADAAKLFANLLAMDTKEGGAYAASICASTVPNVVLVSCSATAPDGTGGAMQTSDGTVYKMANKSGSGLLNGRRGTLLLDKNGQVLTFVPAAGGRTETITVASAKADSLTDSSGRKYTVSSSATVYYNGETTTYGAVYGTIPTGSTVTLYFNNAGAVEYLFVGSGSTSTAAVIVYDKGSTAGFAELAGGNSYTIYKNGLPATANDLRQYDVATYDGRTNSIRVCDTKIVGTYENCSPNPTAPTKITVLGHQFNVLPTAVESLAKFKLGSQMTLLLTEDNQVAGVVEASGNVASGNALGVVTELSASSAKVQLLCGLTVSGDPNLTETEVRNLSGQLVQVSSSRAGGLNLSRTMGGGTGTLDVGNRKLGNAALADNVVIFEKVGSTGAVSPISLSEIRGGSVSPSKISYVRKDWAGRVSVLVLDDVTGNGYTYGKPSTTSDGEAGTLLSLEYGNGKTLGPIGCNYGFSGKYIGVALSGDGQQVTRLVNLNEVGKVSNSAWSGNTLVMANGQSYAVAEDVVCYNRSSKSWMTLTEARSYSGTTTLYADGYGVVRVVEVG